LVTGCIAKKAQRNIGKYEHNAKVKLVEKPQNYNEGKLKGEFQAFNIILRLETKTKRYKVENFDSRNFLKFSNQTPDNPPYINRLQNKPSLLN